MAAPTGKVPIVASVRAGLDFVTSQWRALLPIALAGMAGALLISGLAQFSARTPPMAFLTLVLNLAVVAGIYAAFLGVALKAPEARRGALAVDASRVITAMAIVGFFVLLIMFVAFLAGGVVVASMLMPYQAEIEAASGDPAVMNALLERMFAENPAPFLVMAAIYSAVWLALTSRLYLVAPATVAESRLRTFETWPWTKGALLRITAARLLLLAPATLVLLLVQNAMEQWVGVGAEPPPAAALLVLVFMFASLLVLAIEAGLSAFLYRGLRPPSP